MAQPPHLQITPPDFRFTDSRINVGYISRITLTNKSGTQDVGFKFKTNAPARYSVKPVMGVVKKGGGEVDVFVRSETKLNPQDRFLLQSLPLSPSESTEINSTTWKQLDRRRMNETFIDCRFREGSPGAISGSPRSAALTGRPNGLTATVVVGAPMRGRGDSTSSYKSLSMTPPVSRYTAEPVHVQHTELKPKQQKVPEGSSLTHSVDHYMAISRYRYSILQTVIVSAVCLVLGLLVPWRMWFDRKNGVVS